MKVVTTRVGRAARETRTQRMAHVLETRLEDWDPENAAPASLSLLSQTLSLPTLPFVINVLFITSKQKPSKFSKTQLRLLPGELRRERRGHCKGKYANYLSEND